MLFLSSRPYDFLTLKYHLQGGKGYSTKATTTTEAKTKAETKATATATTKTEAKPKT